METKHDLYPPFSISIGSWSVRVFRVNTSPRLRVSSRRELQAKWLHTHFAYEVFFVVDGKLELLTEQGSREFSDSVVIIPPHLSHISIPEAESYCLLFSFDGSASIDRWLERGICSLPMTAEMAFYIRQLTRKTLEGTQESEWAAEHLASLIFLELLHAVKPEHQSLPTGKSRHINAIDTCINRQLSEKLTLEAVADQVHLSPKQVSRILRQEYGSSFHQLLQNKRLANAVSLLKNTDMPIERIAVATFGASSNYFYAVFREKYGMTPLRYRKELRSR